MPQYLHYFVMENVLDVFDANAIWHAPSLPLFARKMQLRDLLERYPRQRRADMQCFSHVRVFLPSQALLEDQHLYRGKQTADLIADLSERHQNDLANFLGTEQVRYEVLADACLEAEQIGIQFGHALYLPAARELPQYRLQCSSDSAIWQDVGAIYAQQRLALLGAQMQQDSLVARHWPAALGGDLLLINDGPGSQLQLQAYPPDVFEIHFDAQQEYYVLNALGNRAGVELGQARRLFLKPELLSASNATLKLPVKQAAAPQIAQPTRQAAIPKTAPESKPVQKPLPTVTHAPLAPQAEAAIVKPQAALRVWQPRPAAPATSASAKRNSPEKTAQALPPTQTVRAQSNATKPALPPSLACSSHSSLDDELTYVPRAPKPCRISLVALALPRLSRYLQSGVAEISFGFGLSEQVGRHLSLHSGSDALLNFSVDDEDQIAVSSPAGRRKLSLPEHFEPVAGQSLDLVAVTGAMQEMYACCLYLPHALHAELPFGARTTFGRAGSALAQLRVLDQLAKIRARQTQAEVVSIDRIGLSRKAFTMRNSESAFHIQREAASQTLFHLDQDLNLVQALGSEEYTLPNGHHLLAGHYVLRMEIGSRS
mgnify:CR=1 FL=1